MPEPSNLQVVLMGLVTVFISLMLLIIMIQIMSRIIRAFEKNAGAVQGTNIEAQTVSAPSDSEMEKVKVAISVAVAEDLGSDVSHLRIHSIKKIQK